MGLWIGGDRCYKKGKHKSIFVALHWINGERAMCLYPISPSAKSTAYVILEPAAHRYADNRGMPSPGSDALFDKIVDVLAMVQTGQSKTEVRDAVLKYMPDLLRMPPEPDWEEDRFKRGNVDEISIAVDGKKLIEEPV